MFLYIILVALIILVTYDNVLFGSNCDACVGIGTGAHFSVQRDGQKTIEI
jgi:hypothetical protein